MRFGNIYSVRYLPIVDETAGVAVSKGKLTTNTGTLSSPNSNGSITFTSTSGATEVYVSLEALPPNTAMRLNNDIIKNTADGPLYITLQQQEANGEWQTVSSTNISTTGNAPLSGKPSNYSALRLKFSGASFTLNKYTYQRVDEFTTSAVVLLCSSDDDFEGDYRFGFNNMEKDDEIKGSGNSLDFGARIYDSRLGRWLSLDPLQKKYPSLSAYNFVANSPLMFVDPDGREIYFIVDNQYVKVAKATLMKTKEGKALYNEYAKNSKVDIYIGVGKTPGANASTYQPYTMQTEVTDKATGKKESKRILADPYLDQIGYSSFKGIDISKSGKKQVYFIQFDPDQLKSRDQYHSAETFYHEIMAHVKLKKYSKEGTISSENEDHTAFGLKYKRDSKGKVVSVTFIKGGFAEKFHDAIEKLKGKEKPQPSKSNN